MILTDEELEDRISSPDNLINSVIVREIAKGGKVFGDSNIPPLVRDLIGIVGATSNEKQIDIANEFGVSQPTVSTNSRGMLSETFSKDRMNVIDNIRSKKTEDAHDLALDALVGCVTGLKDQLADPLLTKLMKPKDLSKIATDMSKVVSNLKDKNEAGIINNTQVVLLAPPMRKESQYEILDV